MMEFTKIKLTSFLKSKQKAAYDLAKTFEGLKEVRGSSMNLRF